jgi:NAD(P)H dehydrogenase (quinone)
MMYVDGCGSFPVPMCRIRAAREWDTCASAAPRQLNQRRNIAVAQIDNCREDPLRALVLFAHPVETSFGAGLHTTVVETLRARGHEVDDCDLNAEEFDPVMTRQDRIDYYDVAVNRRRVAPYVERLLKADALVFSFPVWNMGFPAILKGFVDKVFLPGVSFNLTGEGAYAPSLHNIKRLGVVCTYGGSHWTTFLMGDPPRRFLKRTMLLNCAPGARCDYLAHYDMDHTTPARRIRFLMTVERKFSTW